MIRSNSISVLNLVSSLSRVIDLMETAVVDHHLRTAYLSLAIAEEANLPMDSQRDAVIAALLHDVGAFHFGERLDLLSFEVAMPHQHAEAGYQLLNQFDPFRQIAEIIRFHHVPWAGGSGETFRGLRVPRESHILHLADRIAVLVRPDKPVLSQTKDICRTIQETDNRFFVPEFVDAFSRLAPKEFFWLQATSTGLEANVTSRSPDRTIELDIACLESFAYLICRLIDFKSEFTAAHSSGVAASAAYLARAFCFSDEECRMMKVSAFLHDLGKLSVPAEILEKPGKLDEEEREVMVGHAYYTYEILSRIPGLEIVTEWSSMHQERLNGHGYPFHREAGQLPLGSRLLAVADVFTALAEDRPYRAGLPKKETLAILDRMGEDYELDARIIKVLEEHYDAIDEQRAEAQRDATREYREFRESLIRIA